MENIPPCASAAKSAPTCATLPPPRLARKRHSAGSSACATLKRSQGRSLPYVEQRARRQPDARVRRHPGQRVGAAPGPAAGGSRPQEQAGSRPRADLEAMGVEQRLDLLVRPRQPVAQARGVRRVASFEQHVVDQAFHGLGSGQPAHHLAARADPQQRVVGHHVADPQRRRDALGVAAQVDHAPRAIQSRQRRGPAIQQLARDVVLDDVEIMARGQRQHLGGVGRFQARSRGIVQRGVDEQQPGPVQPRHARQGPAQPARAPPARRAPAPGAGSGTDWHNRAAPPPSCRPDAAACARRCPGPAWRPASAGPAARRPRCRALPASPRCARARARSPGMAVVRHAPHRLAADVSQRGAQAVLVEPVVRQPAAARAQARGLSAWISHRRHCVSSAAGRQTAGAGCGGRGRATR